MRTSNFTELLRTSLLAAAVTVAIATPASADDTDVFNAFIASQVKPSVLFLLDYSGSMEQDVNNQKIPAYDDETQSKFEVLTDAVNAVLADDVIMDNVNVGLGPLFQKETSGIRWPISDLTADANTIDPAIAPGSFTVADMIGKQMDRSFAHGATPTVNALAEAAAYFTGGEYTRNGVNPNQEIDRFTPDVWDPVLERYHNGDKWTAMPSTYDQTNGGGYTFGGGSTSAGDSWRTPRYKSPIEQCQANFIVLISDGAPTVLDETPTLNSTLNAAGVAGGRAGCEPLKGSLFSAGNKRGDKGDCGQEIVEYLADEENDLVPGIIGSHVKTFTIGFSLDENSSGYKYLDLLAKKGKGQVYEASSPESLQTAIKDALKRAMGGSENFAELAIDVDTTSLTHDNRTYLSLFAPSVTDSWEGNLKGFFLDTTGLLDVNGNPATFVDDDGLKFSKTSRSFWSDSVDGNDIMVGGASEGISNFTPGTRNIYTYTGGGTALTSNENELVSTNTEITNRMLGNPAAGVREQALDWLASAPMGDPLHTKPTVVKYEDQAVVYVMTNQGFLHAFDTTTPVDPLASDTSGGEEIFAFMPQELLQNIPDLYQPTLTGNHLYGLDGGLTRWHEDENGNGIVDGDDTLLLVFGMRRGGNNYYAIDVTEPQNPVFKWQIDPSMNDFGQMAQTWSRPSLITVKNSDDNDRKGDDTDRVLAFAAGYDANLIDTDSTRPRPGAAGNAVYLIDQDGDEVLTISDPGMRYSISSDLATIDADRNGVVDRLYFGDQGGLVWRADIGDVSKAAETEVTLFADVSSGGFHQPIYYAPTISLNVDDSGIFAAVAFATGDRTDPLNPSSQNALFMLKDKDYKVGPPAVRNDTIRLNEIADFTDNEIGSTNQFTRQAAEAELASSRGWRVHLNTGEKGLSQVEVYEGKFMATTFEPGHTTGPNGGAANPCVFDMTARLYIMDILDATPIEIQPDGSEVTIGLGAASRITNLDSTTIPSKPVVTLQTDANGSATAQIIVDKDSLFTVNRTLKTVYWHAK